MSWFNNVPNRTETPEGSADSNAVKIIAEKNAHKSVVEQAKKSQDDLNKLLEQNHFTITISIAAGSKRNRKK